MFGVVFLLSLCPRPHSAMAIIGFHEMTNECPESHRPGANAFVGGFSLDHPAASGSNHALISK